MTLDAKQKRGVLFTIAATLLFIAGILGMFVHSLTRTPVLSEDELKAKGTFLFDKPREFGEFNLLSDTGQPFTPDKPAGQVDTNLFWLYLLPGYLPYYYGADESFLPATAGRRIRQGFTNHHGQR